MAAPEIDSPDGINIGNVLIHAGNVAGAVMRHETWIQHTQRDTNVAVGTIPANSFVIRSFIDVTVGFNDSGFNLMSIGTSGDNDRYGTDISVSSTGLKTPAAGIGIGYESVQRDATCRYSGENVNSSAGKALVVVEYYLVSAQP